MRTFVLGLSILPLLPATAVAAEPGTHPYSHWTGRVRTIDLSPAGRAAAEHVASPTEQPDLGVLDEVEAGVRAADPDGAPPRTGLPAGWVQRGGVVLPQAIDDGTLVVEPESIFAVEDIPGNRYPRKHTLYLNFSGGTLHSGSDNSAESKSQLAMEGNYPVFEGGEAKAVSVAQGVAADVANFGINVVYLDRPEKVLPYTMAMIGGGWQDTNLEMPAGGVAPGADCGALGQRHVVYAFQSASVVQLANTASQEAGHAWGLDHNVNCGSVMSYCGGGDGVFSASCDGLCENQCQGQAGCRLTHDMFCGTGNDQQNEQEELAWIFGGNEPDVEDPTAEIVEPADGAMFDAPAEVDLRAIVDDNYGGFGWKFVIEQDGEVIVDQVDYDREVDDQYRAALNLTGLPQGSYTFRIEVADHFGGVGMDEITFQVGMGAATSADDGSGDDSGDGDGTGGSDSAVEDSGSADDGTGGDETSSFDRDADKGCACTSDPATRWSGALILFALAGLCRRRVAA